MTIKLLNLPGAHAVREQDKRAEDISAHVVVLIMLGPIAFIVAGLRKINLSAVQVDSFDWAVIFFILSVSIWYGIDLTRKLRARRRYVKGRDTELATAQELSSLARRGCGLVHSVPIGRADIDHVVVGPDAVYTVETKSRLEPKGRGRKQVEMKYVDGRLEFSGIGRNKTAGSGRQQARFLAEHRLRRTGENVAVRSVLALPGWYVVNAQKHAGDVRVVNPTMAGFQGGI